MFQTKVVTLLGAAAVVAVAVAGAVVVGLPRASLIFACPPPLLDHTNSYSDPHMLSTPPSPSCAASHRKISLCLQVAVIRIPLPQCLQ